MAEFSTTVKLPPQLAKMAEEYVREGWSIDMNSLIVEALRRYMETHQAQILERFIEEDVEWGLNGDE
ncbi:MAG: CopG family transcriptional regulator [Chloroflexi bacterium]|nr:CopG family transcriptional regulator [Chloroflexota bacterium]MDL1944747.1 CopG family transcriptional regulator [Chloroflexi bacterium CFX2]